MLLNRKVRGVARRGLSKIHEWKNRRHDRFLRSCGTIVHVGANSGQERDHYEKFGLNVIWFEPIPEIFEQLLENIRPYGRQIAIRALLSDKVGTLVDFNIASNAGASSSILDLALHTGIWPEIKYIDRVQMVTSTLDAELVRAGIDADKVNALVLDTQGSELLVLKGAHDALRYAQYVKAEAADFEAYKNCTTLKGIDEHLTELGFSLVRKDEFARHPNGGRYFDLLFKRRI